MTIGYEQDLVWLDGENEKTYPITIESNVQGRTDIKASKTINLVLKNPCIDPNYVTIGSPALLPD